MTGEHEATTEIRGAIESLIENGSTYNVEQLDRIYHDRLDIMMIDQNGDVSTMNKAQNMEIFRSRHDRGAEPLSRWAQFNYVHALGDTGRVVVTRKMQLRDRPEKFVLAIDLVRENMRWQVIREVVFVQPIE